MKLENKTIIVTESGRGIGKYISKRLCKEGANIVVTGKKEADIEKVCNEINDDGGKAIFIKGDVTKEEDVNEVINKTIRKFGKIDDLVNNAGAGLRKLLWETRIEEFEEIMDVNVKGVFLYMKNTLPKMKDSLMITSGAGKTGIPTLSVLSLSNKW